MNIRAKAPLYFIIGSIACQAGALGLVLAMAGLMSGPWQATVFHTLAALALATLFRLSVPWIVVNGAVAPAAMLSSANPWAGTVSLALVVVLALLFAPALWTRVPYFPTSRTTYETILGEVPISDGARFIDIGCGFGPLLSYVAVGRPTASIYGIELGFIPYLMSKVRSYAHENITVTFGDFWKIDLGEFDVVYAFLSPAAMERLWEKVQREMKSGSMFISNSFEVPGHATRVHELSSGKLFVFVIP